jgi:hypothetical protein
MSFRYRGINIPNAYDQRDALILAARKVIASWSSGDLAGAVNQLEEALKLNNRCANSQPTPRDEQIDGSGDEARRAYFKAIDEQRARCGFDPAAEQRLRNKRVKP